MKKIENLMCEAVTASKDWRLKNTAVCVVGGFLSVTLHGNVIYWKDLHTGKCKFTLHGWNSVTTRSRLRALGVDVISKNWTPYYNGQKIDSRKIYAVQY